MNRMNLLVKTCVVVLFTMAAISGCKKDDLSSEKASSVYYILDKTKIGTGANVVSGNTVTVKYKGTLIDGTVFDNSANHGDGTFTYVHKADRLIPGWEEGIEHLNKGSRATFLIPSDLAYGSSGVGSIPPNAPLIFVIEVVDIK